MILARHGPSYLIIALPRRSFHFASPRLGPRYVCMIIIPPGRAPFFVNQRATSEGHKYTFISHLLEVTFYCHQRSSGLTHDFFSIAPIS